MKTTKKFLRVGAIGICFVLVLVFMVVVGGMGTDTAQAKGHLEPKDLVRVPENEPWMVEITEDTASQYNQLCVRNDGKYYSLAGDIPAPLYVDEMRALGFRVSDRAEVFVRESYETVISWGDVAVPVVSAERGTKLVHFYNTDEAVAAFQKAEQFGYTIFLVKSDGGIILDGVAYPCDGFEVLDDSGQIVKDYRDLERGAKYTVYWYEEDDQHVRVLHARPMVANCRVYSVDAENNHVYSGAVGPDGYAEYDVSDLENGLYFTHLGGFVEIQNAEF